MRLDEALSKRRMIQSRSQAANLIRLGKVFVNGKPARKPAANTSQNDDIRIQTADVYVSRAALKLKSVSARLKVIYSGKTVLDIGSSTGGFTQYSLQQGAAKVISVDVGTDQLHPSLRGDNRIELHEKTDIRNFPIDEYDIDMAVMDVSFISSREVIPYVVNKMKSGSQYLVMLKPQFEAGPKQKNKGVIKNNAVRREILKEFEFWVKDYAKVVAKADSGVSGAKGNTERFYLLRVK